MKTPVGFAFDMAGSLDVDALTMALGQTDTETPVAVAVPAWFGMADRHELATYLDPSGVRPLGLVSSTLAGVYGHDAAASNQRPGSVMLCLDVRRGWSAGLVRFEQEGLTEIAAWGIGPHEVTGQLDERGASSSLVDHLVVAASATSGDGSITAVLVIDDAGDRADLIREALRQSDQPWAARPGRRRRLAVCGGGRAGDAWSLGIPGALGRGLGARLDSARRW